MMNQWKGRGFRAKLAVSGVAASALVAMMSAPAHAVVGPESNGYSDPGNPTSINIPESATVSGGTASPRIECGWALPDANASGGAETSNTNTAAADYNGNNGTGPKAPSTSGPNAFQYGSNDDDPATTPTNAAGAPTTPCQLGTPAGQPNPGSPTQAGGALHMIQVLPNAEDSPAERRIELWSAVDDTQGVSNLSSVYWDIRHPDGSLKYEIFGVQSGCYGAEGTATSQPMFAEAVSTGQLSSSAVSDATNGMIALCNEGVKTLWHQAFDVSKDQPNGTYLITETAVDKDGNVAQLTYSLDIISFFDLAVDFTSVNYGTVSANSASVIAGDTNFSAGDGRPTVTNRGNSGEQIGLVWGPMIGATLGKCINNFDAKFGTFGPGSPPVNPASNAALLESITGVATCPAAGSPNGSPSAEVDFNPTGSQLLCPNDDGKLDLSIDPQLDTPPPPSDTYSGSLTVVARSSVQVHNGCPTDNGSVYTPNSGIRTT